MEWLKEQNKKRPSESAHAFIERLDKSSLTKEDKARKIIEFTERLEKKAKRKEQNDPTGGTVDDELDGLYL